MYQGARLSATSARRNAVLEFNIRVVYMGVLLPKAGTTMTETFMSAVFSPDLDPSFVMSEDQSYHVMADVCQDFRG